MKEFRSPAYLVAAQVLALQPSLVAYTTPVYFGALTRDLGFSATQLATITSAEVAGAVCAAVTMALNAGRLNVRWVAMGGAALLALALLGCVYVEGFGPLLALRVLVGAAIAMLASAANVYLSATARPVRWYAWQMTLTTLVTMGGLIAVPALEARFGMVGVYGVLLLLAPATLLAAATLPARPKTDVPDAADAPAHAPASATWRNPAAIVAVLGIMLYAGYVYPTYNFSERMGVMLGLTPLAVGFVLSATTPVGIVGSLLASAFPDRFGLFRPMLVATALVAVGGAALLLLPSPAGFWVAMVMLSFVWNFAQPYLFGAVSRVDPDGRFVIVMGPAQELMKAAMMFVISAGLAAQTLVIPTLAGALLMAGATAATWVATRRAAALRPAH